MSARLITGLIVLYFAAVVIMARPSLRDLITFGVCYVIGALARRCADRIERRKP